MIDELIEWLIIEGTMEMLVPVVAAYGIEVALSLAGNAGQISVIEHTEDGFIEGAEVTCADEGEAAGPIEAACPYPDAISEIIEEAGAAMDDLAQTIRDAMEFTEEFF